MKSIYCIGTTARCVGLPHVMLQHNGFSVIYSCCIELWDMWVTWPAAKAHGPLATRKGPLLMFRALALCQSGSVTARNVSSINLHFNLPHSSFSWYNQLFQMYYKFFILLAYSPCLFVSVMRSILISTESRSAKWIQLHALWRLE